MEKDKRTIYMDFAASTPVKEEVVEAMRPFWSEKFGNPSSIHTKGREAKSALDKTRLEVAKIFNCETHEIYFTSGGTESDNLAILGVTRGNFKSEILNSKQAQNSKSRGHIITTQIEHHAVLNACKQLEKEGFEVTYLSVGADGVAHLEDIRNAIRPETILISVMHVNNEIGTVQSIAEIAKALKQINSSTGKRIYFHTDAVQAPGFFSLDVKELGVDLMSISGHKFGGPKGVGVLYVKKDVPIVPLEVGGEQELALRPGTENVASIVGMVKALEIANQDRENKNDEKVLKLRNYFEEKLIKLVPAALVVAKNSKRSPGISAVAFKEIDSAIIVMNLDLEGIYVSSGAACSSGSVEISHVIKAQNLPEPYIGGAVRFCFSESLTKDDLDFVLEILHKQIARIRKS